MTDFGASYRRHFEACSGSGTRGRTGGVSGRGRAVACPPGSPPRSGNKEGRKSIDAVAIFAGLLTIGAAGRPALQELGPLPKLLERKSD